MRIALNKENSGWVIDKIANDFIKYTRHEIVPIDGNPDLFWGCDCFPFKRFINRLPKECVTCVQIHHIVKNKLKEYDFDSFNKADCVISPSHITIKSLESKINVPVHYLPYWVLSETLKARDEKKIIDFKESHKETLIGYFQKDTERSGKPKLEKGPDQFLELIRSIKDSNIKVVLTGYRRSYVINGLKEMKVPYIYIEKCKDMNPLYDSIDWYFCTSRVEGGPQAILEASYRKVKILSTDCGVAKDILSPDCICYSIREMADKFKKGIDRVEWNYKNVVDNYLPKIVIEKWDDFFEEIVKK